MNDDLECLKIHGCGMDDGDSSTDNDEEDSALNEAYSLMKPAPIPPDIIRERAIYRPPSPNEEELIQNKIVGYHEGQNHKTVGKPEKLPNDLVSSKDTFEVSVVSEYGGIIKEFFETEKKIKADVNKKSIEHLNELHSFWKSLNYLKYQVLDKMTISKNISLDKNRTSALEVSISDIQTFIAHFYAFLVNECCYIKNEIENNNECEVLLTIRMRNLLDKLVSCGITKIIRCRITNGWDNLMRKWKIEPPVKDIEITNEEILEILSIKKKKNEQKEQNISKESSLNIQNTNTNVLTNVQVSYRDKLCANLPNAQSTIETKKELGNSISNNTKYPDKKEIGAVISSFKINKENMIDSVQKIIAAGSHLSEMKNQIETNNTEPKKKKKNRRKKKNVHIEELYSDENITTGIVGSEKECKEKKQEEVQKNSMNGKVEERMKNGIKTNKTITGQIPSVSESIVEPMAFDHFLKLIENADMRTINTLNFIQYSLGFFEKRNCNAILYTLKQIMKFLDKIQEYSSILLDMTSKEKYLILKKTHEPLIEICKANINSFVLANAVDLVNNIKNQSDDTEYEKLFGEISELIAAFGTIEQIYDKIKLRNDVAFYNIASKVCSVVPLTNVPADNIGILKSISKFEGVKQINVQSMLLVLPRYYEFSDFNYEIDYFPKNMELQLLTSSDLNDIEQLITLQSSIRLGNGIPRDDNIPFKHFNDLVYFMFVLRNLEQSKPDSCDSQSFIHEYLNHLNLFGHEHILKIMISNFYAFILVEILIFLNETLKPLKQKDVEFYTKNIMYLFNSICPFEELRLKLYHRNDAFYSLIILSLGKRKIVVQESSEKLILGITPFYRVLELPNLKNESLKHVEVHTEVTIEERIYKAGPMYNLEIMDKSEYFETCPYSRLFTRKFDSKATLGKQTISLNLQSTSGYKESKFMVFEYEDSTIPQINDVQLFVHLGNSLLNSLKYEYINFNNEKRVFLQSFDSCFLLMELPFNETCEYSLWLNLLKHAGEEQEHQSFYHSLLHFFDFPSLDWKDQLKQFGDLSEIFKKPSSYSKQHSVTTPILKLISREISSLNDYERYTFRSMSLNFEYFFMSFLKRIMKLVLTYNVLIVSIQRFNDFDRILSNQKDIFGDIFIKHESKIFTLCDIYEFFTSSKRLHASTPLISKVSKQDIQKLLVSFEIKIFSSFVPFSLVQNICDDLVDEIDFTDGNIILCGGEKVFINNFPSLIEHPLYYHESPPVKESEHEKSNCLFVPNVFVFSAIVVGVYLLFMA